MNQTQLTDGIIANSKCNMRFHCQHLLVSNVVSLIQLCSTSHEVTNN